MYSSSKTYFYSSNTDEKGHRQVVQNGYGMNQHGNDTTYYVLDDNSGQYKPVDNDEYTNYINNIQCPKKLFYQRPPLVPELPVLQNADNELEQLRRENRYLKSHLRKLI